MLMQQPAHQERRAALKLHNPFTLRVGQVFTGFGVGCGIGIGVGRAINLRAIPVLGSVAGEAIGSFSSLRPHVDHLGKRLGIKNIQAGVGCGVGIGHGFGIGISLKPGTVQELKQLTEHGISLIKERVKSFTSSPGSEEGTGTHETTSLINEGKIFSNFLSPDGLKTQSSGNSLQSTSMALTKLQQAQEPTHGEVNRLQTENTILLTLLRHQDQIELLRKENAALKQALAEAEGSPSDPKPYGKADHITHSKTHEDRKCFECKRRGRQRS